jgi:hypothetical protein
MSRLRLNEVAVPAIPAAGKAEIFIDVADEKVKVIDDQGFSAILSPDGLRDKNRITNGDFAYARRQVPTALTSSTALAGGRQFAFDNWFQSNTGGTAIVQTQQIDNTGGAEAGLAARQYAKFKVITAVAKLVIGQAIEANNCAHLNGTKVRVQMKLKYSIAASMTVRLGLAYVTGAGTVDNIGVRTAAGFISTIGGTGVDPVLTAANNMAYIAPNLCETSGAGSVAIVGSAVDCVLTANWARYSATFTVPAAAKNLVPMVWTNAALATGDELNLSECGLYAGEEVRDWHPMNEATDVLSVSRTYAKSFPLLIAPAQNAGLLGALNGICSLAGAVALAGRVWWNLPTQLRRTPVAGDVTLYNPSAANALMRHPYIGTPIDMGATALTANLTSDNIEIAATGVATTLVGSVCAIHAAIDVDI